VSAPVLKPQNPISEDRFRVFSNLKQPPAFSSLILTLTHGTIEHDLTYAGRFYHVQPRIQSDAAVHPMRQPEYRSLPVQQKPGNDFVSIQRSGKLRNRREKGSESE
jgi:hypothetical protein